MLGHSPSIETRKKLSEAIKGTKCYWFGKKLSKQHVKNIKIGHLGLKHSIEERKAKSKRQSIPIIQFDLNMKFIKEWKSAKEVKQLLGLHDGSIGYCCKGRSNYKQVGGFIWKYKNKI